jgi:sugar diacid utilization regulator
VPAERNRARDPLRSLIRRADRRRAALAGAIVDHCLEHLPHYRGLPAAMVAGIRANVRRHLALFYRVTLESGRPLTDEDLEFSRATARERAGQDIPLGEFLMFFHVGLRVAWEDLIEAVGEDPRLRAGLLDRVAAVITNQQLLMTALTEAYVQERERLSRFREQDLDDFFRLLLAEDTLQSVLDARARALRIDLSEARSVAVFASPAGLVEQGTSVAPGDVRQRLLALDPGADVRVGRCREGFAALLSGPPEAKQLAAVAAALLGPEARVGVGAPAREAGIRRSAVQALRALRLGALLQRAERVHLHADLAVADLLDVDSEAAGAFMRDVLGPLARAGASRTHLATLRQLARHGYRVKLAAAALDVHPHTLSYRMKQLRRRYGLDLDDPEVRLRVQLALLILDAGASPRPERA